MPAARAKRPPRRTCFSLSFKVALDATPLIEETGGISRYTTELSRALSQQFPEDNYWLLSDQQFRRPSHAPQNLHSGARPKTAAERRWWLWGLNREMSRLHIDVFHGTGFSVPYLRRGPVC